MSHVNRDDLGRLLLRVTVGGLLLLHGIAKLRHGVGGIEGMLAAKSLPRFIAYGVFVGEVVAPLAVLAGVYTRLAGLIIAFNMLVAIWLTQAGQVFELEPRGGGWAIESPMVYLLGGLVVACLGAGRYALRGGRGRWD